MRILTLLRSSLCFSLRLYQVFRMGLLMPDSDVLCVFLELLSPFSDGKRSCVIVQHLVDFALVSDGLPVRRRCCHLAEKVPGVPITT